MLFRNHNLKFLLYPLSFILYPKFLKEYFKKMLKKILKSPISLLRRLYNWTINLAQKPHADIFLFLIAFAESSFFPIPPDPLLIALGLAHHQKIFRFAFICSLASVLGGIFGYIIGFGFYEIIGEPIVNFYNLQNLMETIKIKYENYAFITILTAAFTPIPYKLITISAGLFKINIFTLIIASIIGRSSRFFIVAIFLHVFGKKIAEKIEKYFDLLSLIFFALLIGGFILLKILLH